MRLVRGIGALRALRFVLGMSVGAISPTAAYAAERMPEDYVWQLYDSLKAIGRAHMPLTPRLAAAFPSNPNIQNNILGLYDVCFWDNTYPKNLKVRRLSATEAGQLDFKPGDVTVVATFQSDASDPFFNRAPWSRTVYFIFDRGKAGWQMDDASCLGGSSFYKYLHK